MQEQEVAKEAAPVRDQEFYERREAQRNLDRIARDEREAKEAKVKTPIKAPKSSVEIEGEEI